MSMHRALFWLAGAAGLLALVVLLGHSAKDRSAANQAGMAGKVAGSDTTALILVTTSTNGDLAECG